MSNIVIHRVEDIAKRHIARIAQIEAMPPQLTRGEFDFWHFNRKGYQHDTAWPRRARLGDPGLVADGPTDGGGFPEPAPAAEFCPRTMALVVYLNDALMTNNVYLASTSDTVPFRFRIDEISLNHILNSGGGFPSWNAFVGYEEHRDARLLTTPSGEPVFRKSPNSAGLGAASASRILGPFVNGYFSDQQVPYKGSGPYAASQRISIAASVLNGAAANFEAVAIINVIECQESFGRQPPPGGGPPPPPGGGPPPPPPGGGPPPPGWEEIF